MHLKLSYRRNVAKGSNLNSTDLVTKEIPKEDFITKFNVFGSAVPFEIISRNTLRMFRW